MSEDAGGLRELISVCRWLHCWQMNIWNDPDEMADVRETAWEIRRGYTPPSERENDFSTPVLDVAEYECPRDVQPGIEGFKQAVRQVAAQQNQTGEV